MIKAVAIFKILRPTRFFFAGVLLFLLIGAGNVNGATRTASVTGNWSATATWGGAAVPTSADAVTINNGITVTVNVVAACNTLTTINTGGVTISGTNSLAVTGLISMARPSNNNTKFTIAVGAGTLSAGSLTMSATATTQNDIISISTGTVTINGTVTTGTTGCQFTFTGAGTLDFHGAFTSNPVITTFAGSKVIYSFAGAQTVDATTYNNLTLSGSGAKTTTAGVTVNGILSMEGTATASVAPTYGAAATLQYNTATARSAGIEWISPFAATGGIIIANSGAITLNLAKVFNASVPLTINSGATINTSASNFQLTFGGDFHNNGGTLTANASPVVIAGTAATQSIDGFTTTGIVSMTKTAGTATFLGNVNGAGLTINGTGGTLNLGAGLTHTFTGVSTITAGTINGGSSLLKLGGNVSATGGTFTAGTGTVEWNAAGAQTIAPSAYNNLIFSGSGAKSVTTGTSVTGNLSINGAIASIGAGLNISVGSLTMGGLNKVNGTWGSTTSTATNKDNTYFAATTGYVTVTTDTRPTSAISGVTASQSICFGTATITLTGTVSSGTVYPANGETVGVMINGVTQNATIAGGAGGFSINFTTPTIPSSATPYTITYAYTGDVNLKAASNNTSTTLTVNPVTVISSQSTATQTQCLNGTFTAISVTATGTGTITYQWYKNTTANNTGGTLLTGATSASYTPLATATGTLYYYCIVSGTCGSVTSAVSGAFIVNPAAAISSQSTATQTQCINGTFTPISVTATGTSTITYQWYSNTTASTTGGTLLTGATSASYTPLATATGTLYYYCIVHSNCGSNITSAVSGAFIVNTATSISSQSTATQTQCLNGTFTAISVTATGTALTYQWYSNTTASTTGGTLLTGATSASYTPLATATGTLYYYCIVSGTCGSVTSAVSGAFIVNPATAISSQSTANQTQCINGTFTAISVTATGTGTITYQWYKNTTASTSGGTLLTGATSAIYTPSAAVAGTLYYYCVMSGTCGSVTSAVSGAFIVNTATSISSQLTATQTQCLNGTFTAISVTATGTALTYQWYSNTTASTTGGTLLTGATSASYTPLATATGTLYYYCIVHSNCGSNITSAVSGAFIVNTATSISSQSTATQTQCQNGTFTAISVTASGTGTITYQWYKNTTASTSGGTLLTGAISASYTPLATATGTLYYYCVVSGTCGSVISAVSGAFIVNTGTAISSQSTATQTQCLNDTFTAISVTATGTAITYQWYSNTVANNTTGTIINGATNASYTPSATVTGTFYYYCIVHSDCGTNVTSAVSGAFIVTSASNVTVPAAVAGDATAVLSWTNPASCYNEIMIVAKAASSVSGTPSGDGTAFTASLVFGSGTAFSGGDFVVYKGTTSPQTITNLTNGTQYYFKYFTRLGTIWSSGIETNAMSVGASLASDYYRSRATGNWNATATWESSHDGTNWVNATLTPDNNANTITIQNTHTVSVTASVTVDQVTVNTSGQITVNAGQTLTIANGAAATDMAVNGSIVNLGTITTTGVLVFGSGGTYQHSQNGGIIPTATWDAASTCSVTGITDTAPSGFGQTFGNYVWNCPSQTVAAYSTDGDITVNGNLTLSAGVFSISNGTVTRTLTINGNYIQTGGIFDFNTGTSGNTNMFLGGNLTLTTGAGSMTTSGVGAPNGIITFNGSGIQTISIPTIGASIWVKYSIPSGKSVKLLSNITLSSADLASQAVYQGEIIVNGTLDLSTYAVTQSDGVAGTAVFTVNAGANLITANSGGISGSVSATNMTNTFSSGANYEFQGATTGTFTTTPTINTVNNLTINRSAGVTLNQNIAVNGTLNLASRIFTTGANTITVTNNSTGAVTGGSPTNFVNGPLIWQLATGQTYLYPIGKGSTYLPFGITGITGTNPMLTVEAFTGNAGGTATSPLGSLSNTEYWLASYTGTYSGGSVSLTRQTALAGLNAIGRSATINGAYSSLNGTVSGMSVINSDNTGSSLGYFVMAAKSFITTSAISGSPFCAGAVVSVPFTITGTFTSGNVFTAQLSDASGSFTTPVNIGSLTQVTSGTISGTIAAGTASGSGYRIRVVSSTPVVTGTDNGSDLTVNPLPAQPSTISGNTTVCQNSPQTYSVTGVSGVNYTWTFPSGWTQTAGGTTNSVTVTVGSGSGNVQVTPSTACGSGTSRTLAITTNVAPSAPTTTGATICIGSTATLSASGAVAGDTYKWYDAATAGNLLKTSANNTDNTYTTAVLAATTNYWVSILNSGGCEGLRTLVTATFPTASPDDSNLAGTDSWIGHVYDGMSFTTYYGTYTETEAFNQSFGGNTACFALNSSLGTRTIYTETFSAHYRMNSTKRGLYIADLGSDDGSRLTVDGTLLYNNWADQAYTARPRVLMSLKGTSSLVYDFYQNLGANQVVFQNLTLVMSNTLTTNISQSIYVGGTWSTISGDVFGTLPTGITLSGTGYQWSYSTTPLGTRTTISGATGATYTPSASVAPFNTLGTYYLYRNAILSSTNNLGATPNPYIATNESNAATLIISNVSSINTSTTTLTGLNYPFGFGPSAEQSFIVSGTNLTTNLSVAPSANFEISTGTGASFVATNPITLLVNSGNVSATTIYVRLKAGLSIGTVPAENIVCTSNGLTPVNVACSGSVTAVPVITTSVASLSGFSYPYTGGPSSQQSYTVSGTNLVADVTVTPPASFEISTTSGSGFVSTPITLTPTGGTLAATTIYVRMKSGLGIGGYSENIVSSSTSATSQNVNCSGTVIGSNLILLSTSSLAGFIYTYGSGPSAPQSFTVSGTLLGTNNMLITPAANYEISLSSGSGFVSTPITLTQTGGTVNATTIYVRLVAGLPVGTYAPINIPVSSAGAITKSVGCSGAVVNTPTIMVSKNTLTGFGYMSSDLGPSSPQSFTVSGASLTANVSVTPPVNYEISLNSGGPYQSTALTLTQTGGILTPTTIYARLKSNLTAGNYNGGNIVVTSGALTQNVACVGIVFVSPLITAGINPGTACAGSTVNLTSVGESTIVNRYWQGPNSYYSSLQNPVLTNGTPNMSGTYTVIGNVVVGGNLITNGDFELGNTSFGSSYALSAQTADGMYPESTYDVLVNPHDRHPDFQPCPDHTTGTGKQMVVNGSPVAGAVIWTQSVPVIPGATYEFTYWVQSVVARAPSQLQLYVNGVAVGPVYTADFGTCSWKQFAYNASAGSNTSLNLELINQNTIANGNDFALDDIVFQQILPATSSVDLTVNPNLPVSVSLAASPNPTTTGTNVTFTATPTNGGLDPRYDWSVNGISVVTNSTSPTYNSSTLSNGDIVTITLHSSLMCKTGDPATATVIMMISARVNYWYGFNSTDWGTASNWTASYIPAAGDDVEFATVANYGSVAIRDLYVDIHRTIGSLIDATIRSTVIPSNKKLTVNRNLYLGSSAHINASAQYSTIEFAGTLAQTIPAATFTNDLVYDILINNSHNVTLYGTMRLLHEITAPAGRLDATTQSPTVVYAGDPYAKQTIEMNRYLNNSMYNLGIYNIFGVWLSTTASIYVPHDCTITRGVLTVPPGATLTVDNYTKLDYRAPLPVNYPLRIDYWSCLVLKSDSVLTGSFVHSDLFSSVIGNGTAKVERYMSHTNNWHLYSSPIKDESIHYFLQYNPEIPDLYPVGAPLYGDPDASGMRDYNTTTNMWNPYFYYPTSNTTIGSIGLGKGFNIRTIYNYNDTIGTGRVDATGIPNLNTVNVALARSATPGDYGWNCIGNPFTCALNIRNTANNGFLNAANISQLDPNYIAVYLWDTNNITTSHTTPEYIVINNATTITSVQTAQGFFVKSKNGGGTVTFTKAMQFPNAALSFKSAVVEWPSIKIVARDKTASSSTEIKFVTNTTKGLDPGYDAGLYIANPDFSVYSKLVKDNAIDYTLQCLPDQDYDQYVIPLGVDYKAGGQITFKAETVNLPSGCQAVLEDRLAKIFIRLDLKGATYTATLDQNTKGTGRFFLHTYDAIGSTQPANSELKVRSIAKAIYINGEVSSDARFYLYSVNGKLLANLNAKNQLQNQLDASGYAVGVYLLTIIDRNQKKTIKFVLED